jgi:hypothetical protein
MELKNLFDKAPREYGVLPIIHERMDDFKNEIDGIDSDGFAGVVANVRYDDEEYPNNAEAWKNFENGSRAFINRGMKLWIYDEKGYPSGTAGGAVIDACPQYAGREILYFSYWKTLIGIAKYRADIPWGKLYRAFLIRLGSVEVINISDTLNEKNVLHFTIPEGAWRLVVLMDREIFDGSHAAHSYSEPRKYIDLFNPDATRKFIEVTHAKYKAVLGDEFGKGIKAFFTDEPSLLGWNFFTQAYPLLTWSDNLESTFRKRYGYDISEALLAVFLGYGSNVIKKRCDFWECSADLLADSFFGVIQDWCKANNIASSGHYVLEENLLDHVFCYSSYYRCMKRMDYPGIDQLESEPTMLMRTSVIPAGRLAASFADVYELGETFTEASDHTSQGNNRQISMDWIRASMNWHLAMGINNITSYYKWGHFPKEEIQGLNHYVSRIGTVLRQGKRYSRVAVLYPENAMWTAYKPDKYAFGDYHGQSEEARTLQDTFAGVSWELLHRQIDFDYIDEEEIRNASIEKGIFKVRNRQYECIVLPDAFVMSRAGVEKICAYLESGGKVIAIERLPEYERETGEKAAFSDKLHPYMKTGGGLVLAGKNNFAETEALLPRTISLMPTDIQSVLSGHEGSLKGKSIISENILSHVRQTADGLIIFLCNMGSVPYAGEVTVKGRWQGEIGNAINAQVETIKPVYRDNQTVVNIFIKAYNSVLVILNGSTALPQQP